MGLAPCEANSSFTSPEKEIFFFNICDVITSPEKEKSSAIHYCV
jgi:hypothetical protein